MQSSLPGTIPMFMYLLEPLDALLERISDELPRISDPSQHLLSVYKQCACLGQRHDLSHGLHPPPSSASGNCYLLAVLCIPTQDSDLPLYEFNCANVARLRHPGASAPLKRPLIGLQQGLYGRDKGSLNTLLQLGRILLHMLSRGWGLRYQGDCPNITTGLEPQSYALAMQGTGGGQERTARHLEGSHPPFGNSIKVGAIPNAQPHGC